MKLLLSTKCPIKIISFCKRNWNNFYRYCPFGFMLLQDICAASQWRHPNGILNTGHLLLRFKLFHCTTQRRSFCFKINHEEYSHINIWRCGGLYCNQLSTLSPGIQFDQSILKKFVLLPTYNMEIGKLQSMCTENISKLVNNLARADL